MILGQEDKPSLDDLVHYGVKGMHWGVRKDDASKGKPKVSRFTPEQKTRAKQVAIGTGILVAAAGAAYVAHNKGLFGNVNVGSIAETTPQVKKVIHDVTKQTDIIHAARGKNVGFRFVKNGGLKDALGDYEKAFGADSSEKEAFRRLSDGRIAAAFLDPQGRADFAGRHIPHQVVIPSAMADNIHNLDDVKTKIWPKIADAYDEVYNLPGSTERNNR